MIIIVVGGIGSGKSVYMVKLVKDKQEKCYGNFTVRKAKHFTRLKIENVMIKDEKKTVVNWEFWKEQLALHNGFHIFLDELHNLMHSRRSMSRENITLTRWVSQIRKVTGDNEHYDLVVITQEIERVDLAIRDLAQEIILCSKWEDHKKLTPTVVYKNKRKTELMLPETWIILTHFKGDRCVKRYQDYRDGLRRKNYNGQ